ncbi:TPA: hypothetical protein DCZ32_01645 [Candidatus Uhrbacteria bacterium]|nr:hypothetical protein [Candidatus Uhrbacteria bacterium]
MDKPLRRHEVRKTAMSKDQKNGWIVFFVFALLTFVIGFKYLGNQLRSPFESNYEGPAYQTPEERDQAKNEQMKQLDSDEDGLTDYDELYVYQTSPYIKDTDSDGFSDSVEIASGNNPNCASGATCATDSAEEIRPVVSGPTDIVLSIPGFDSSNPALQLNTQEDLLKYFQTLSSDEIRKMLLDSGMEKELVDKLSDEEIIEIFNQALANIGQADESQELPPAEQSDSGTVQQ